jgi:hypothetical protein
MTSKYVTVKTRGLVNDRTYVLQLGDTLNITVPFEIEYQGEKVKVAEKVIAIEVTSID